MDWIAYRAAGSCGQKQRIPGALICRPWTEAEEELVATSEFVAIHPETQGPAMICFSAESAEAAWSVAARSLPVEMY